MKVVLRLVATLFGFLMAMLTLVLLEVLLIDEQDLGVRGAVLLSSVVLLAAFAAVQLWRLKHNGRYAGLGVILGMLVLMAMGRPRGMPLDLDDLRYLGSCIAVAMTLVLPVTRRACS